jgi:mannose-6-phosphate isomerase-like protein (cupin superfamily)
MLWKTIGANLEVESVSEAGVDYIYNANREMLLAIVISVRPRPHGISFVTEDDSVHQVGVLNWPEGHIIDAHIHNPLTRTIDSTQEVLFIRSGRVRMDLYDMNQSYQCSRELVSGDTVFLVSGGHGFEILEEADIVEVKQGPYLGEGEKTRFAPADNPHWRS